MRAFWLLLTALTLGLAAKDNFIFDYRNDPLTVERIERLEREIGELKASIILVQKNQEKTPKAAPAPAPHAAQLKKLEEAVAALKKENARLDQAQKTIAAAKPPLQQQPAIDTAQLDALHESIEALKADMSKKEGSSVEKADLAPISMQIDLLNEKMLGLEAASRENMAFIQNSAGLPFDRYFPVTKAHIEYFVMGLVIFVALMFLMLLSALGRGRRAEEKASQLARLYQSSSRKMDDRK